MDMAQSARIKIVGIGDSGEYAIHQIAAYALRNLECMAINTHWQWPVPDLNVPRHVIGRNGTAGNLEMGRKLAQDHQDMLRTLLQGAEEVYLVCGMGGGTGSGVAPVLAEMARSMDAYVYAAVTEPLPYEGTQRQRAAETGIAALKTIVVDLDVVRARDLMRFLEPTPERRQVMRLMTGALVWHTLSQLV
jgi:cell division protein FtsZ